MIDPADELNHVMQLLGGTPLDLVQIECNELCRQMMAKAVDGLCRQEDEED